MPERQITLSALEAAHAAAVRLFPSRPPSKRQIAEIIKAYEEALRDG